jgi:FkbM family methyltransferase
MLKSLVKKLVSERFLEWMRGRGISPSDWHGATSYSQEGEDMILRRIFEGKNHGFYVDVGAHHPIRFSNTYYFYKLGWFGINIEPNPDAGVLFRSVRRRDIHLQLGVSESSGELTYYQFNEPALNTFEGNSVQSSLAKKRWQLKATCQVKVERLDRILNLYLPDQTSIDFLSIDVEGLDLSVLKSNDWERYRPKCVLIEILESSLEDMMSNQAYDFMRKHQYLLYAKTCNTAFFLDGLSGSGHVTASFSRSDASQGTIKDQNDVEIDFRLMERQPERCFQLP